MTGMMRNPIPMGTAAAMGQATPATQQLVAKAYGSIGGRSSARRRKKAKASPKRTARKRTNGRKLKFGTPAWRKKYMRKRR
jgi:hypothetical protein